MISVVVPVYNAEKYIDRCVKSIISQTYTDWELFLIDDGSSDNSLSIIQKYAKEDTRITAVHQENQGAGAARNKGLDQVSGDYVVFVDSDDYIEQNYFMLLSSHSEDVVFIDINRRDEKGNIKAKERLSTLSGKTKDDILRGQMTGQILWGGVRKAAKLSLINGRNIRYSEHKVGEEAIYSFLLLYYADTFSFIDLPVYNYEVHLGSLSQTIQEDPWGPVAVAIKEKVQQLKCYEKYADTLNSFFFTSGVVSLSKLAKTSNYMEFKTRAKEKIREINMQMDKTYSLDMKHMNTKARMLKPFINFKLYLVVYVAARMR